MAPESTPELTPELTAELITDTERPTDVALSPDGRLVAWVARPSGFPGEHPRAAVWLAPVDGSVPARRWTGGGADTSPRWSPHGDRLAFLSDRAERGTAGLWVIDTAGGEARPLAVRTRAVQDAAWSPDSSAVAFLAPDELDAEQERRRREERDDADVSGERSATARVWTVGPDGREPVLRYGGDHVAELAWSPDGTRLALLTRPTPELDGGARTWIRVLDGAGPGAWPVTDVCPAGWATGLRWTADGSALLVVAPHSFDPVSGSTVWAVEPVAGAEPHRCGPGPDEEVCGAGVRPVDDPAAPVLVLTLDRLATRLDRRDLDGGLHGPLLAASGDVDAFDAVTTADGAVLALVLSADAGPPEVWAGPADGIRQLSDHFAAWADIRSADRRELVCTAPDGLAIDAVALLPPDAEGPFPTVVLPHGGPYWRSARSLHCSPLDWGQWLAAAGFAVLLPNYRGGSGRGLAFAAAVAGDLGGAEWGDVLAVVDDAVECGIADPDRLGIGGWSQGGFLTAWAVTRTRRFRAAVMGAGVSDWRAMALTSDLPTFEGALAGALPWDGTGQGVVLDRSPISSAAAVTTPTLVLHGERDERVPVSQGTAFARAMRAVGIEVVSVTYPREPHGIAERAHQLDVLRRVRKWFDRYLHA